MAFIRDPVRRNADVRAHVGRALQGPDWLSGYVRDEIEVFVHMEQYCASEFRAGGDQEIRHRGAPTPRAND
jgi:hypothetical protein